MYDKEGKKLLGRSYWNQCEQMNPYRIVSNRGQKYEMDRDKWTTHHNFSNMYDYVIEEMCEASVAEKLDSPVWMNKDDEEYQLSEVFGCKVVHHIKYSDISIAGDEVGGNSSQKDDSYIAGTLYVCERNFTLQSKTSNKEKRFTLMGVTTLLGKPLTWCVIFKSIKCFSETETRIDFTINSCGSSDNQQ